MITLKLKYNTDNHDRILEMIKNYNSIFGVCYNFMFEHPNASTKDIITYINSKNNFFLDTYFKNATIYDSKTELKKSKNRKIVFGGKHLYDQRNKHNISKDEFKLKRLKPLMIVGAAHNKGNCKFQIIDDQTILFKPNRNEHFLLHLEHIGRNYSRKLKRLKELQESCSLPITYRLDLNYIHIIFDNCIFEQFNNLNHVKNRVIGIDMNPNYIGYSILDWKNSNNYKILDSGIFSLKPLNDYDNELNIKGLDSSSNERHYISNKRKYETISIAYKLMNLAKHYQCELFSFEKLNIKNSDKDQSKDFNRLCNNQWNRNSFLNIIYKQCDLYKIKCIEVLPDYSSFMGNLVYRDERLPDPCLASIEISRRGFEFYHQYILKDFEKNKNIIFNNSACAKHKIMQSLEELNYGDAWTGLKDLYYKLKNRNCKYRFPINDAFKHHDRSFSKKHIKSFQIYYKFI